MKRKDTRERPFEWDHSYATFNDESSLIRHCKTNSALQSFQCKICNLTFRWKLGLIRHMQFHTGEKSYKCEMLNIKQKDENERKEGENEENENNNNAESKHKAMVQVEHRELIAELIPKSENNEVHQNTVEIKTEIKDEITEEFECTEYKIQLPPPDNTHTEEKPFKCTTCHKRFRRKNNLNKHVGKNDCDICHRKSDLTKHKLTHVGEKPFKRRICPDGSSKCIHNGEKRFRCDVCQKTFSWKSNYLKHEMTHTGKKPYNCEICLKGYWKKPYFLKHRQVCQRPVNGEEILFDCEICHEKFHSESDFLKHKEESRKNVTTLNYPASQFNVVVPHLSFSDVYTTPNTLYPINHQVAQSPDTENLTSCTSNNDFMLDHVRHIKTTTKESEMKKLQSETPQTGEKPFNEENILCQSEQNMKNHTAGQEVLEVTIFSPEEKICSDTELFKCSKCDAVFAFKAELEKHEVTDAHPRVFQCEICNKKYTRRRELKKHLYVHTGEKPYECRTCFMRFYTNAILVRHRYYMHPEDNP